MAANDVDGTPSLAPVTTPPGVAVWGPLLVALIAPLLILQIAVVRPTTMQLDRMRGQVARLERTIAELKGKEPAAQQAAGLLAELGQQESLLAAADRSLERFARLERKLSRGLDEADHAIAKLDRLDALVDHVNEQTRLLRSANETLVTLAPIADDLQNAIDRAGRFAPAVADVEQLSTRLDDARQITEESLRRVDKLAAVQQTLASRSASVAAANTALDGLLRIESRLNSPTLAIAAAAVRLDEFVALKDAIIAKTDDLPAAFETFELIVGLQEDLQRARVVFQSAQRLVANLVLLEPSLSRLASVVDPMIDRATVRGLAGAELRMVLRELSDRRAEALAKMQPEPDDEVAARPEAAMK